MVQFAFIQALQQDRVVAITHQYPGVDPAFTQPFERIVADAGTDLTINHAAADGDAVIAAAGADIAADGAAGNDDGVGVETGDQVLPDFPPVIS